jgi:hypothetical protein
MRIIQRMITRREEVIRTGDTRGIGTTNGGLIHAGIDITGIGIEETAEGGETTRYRITSLVVKGGRACLVC